MHKDYIQLVEILKEQGANRTPLPMEGYTEKAERLLQEGKFSEAEDFTLRFFYRKKWNSKKAAPYMPAILANLSISCPDVLMRLDAMLDKSAPKIK